MFQSPLKSLGTSAGFGSSPTSLNTLMPSYKRLTHILGTPVQKLSVFIKVILWMSESFAFLYDFKVIVTKQAQKCSIKILSNRFFSMFWIFFIFPFLSFLEFVM